jgi:hypothetical protein
VVQIIQVFRQPRKPPTTRPSNERTAICPLDPMLDAANGRATVMHRQGAGAASTARWYLAASTRRISTAAPRTDQIVTIPAAS